MQFAVVTLFPELVMAVTKEGVVGRAVGRGLAKVLCINPRDYATDVHRTVDDRPYGGGPGMVMKAEQLLKAIRVAKQQTVTKVVYLTPQGQPLMQKKAAEWAKLPNLVLLCGRYEGIDERVVQLAVDEECSIGDYVLSGGELAAMVVIDAVTRLLPDALGHQESASLDSFSSGLLDHPHYTRPEIVEGLCVPDVLRSGNHTQIERWRRKQALGRTWQRRSDLLSFELLSQVDQMLLEEYLQENQASSEVIS